MRVSQFQKTILDWYKDNRRDLPFRKTRDPYKILVSEIMLQQTQVSRVLPKYEEFLKAFPTLEALARSSDKKLLQVWQGLGYWRRAKYLKQTADTITKDYGGKFPKDAETLQKLPGIGPYTARAVACFAFNNTEPFIDTNIRRVYLHFFFKDQQDISDTQILTIAKKAMREPAREWHYALFDYGAIVLKNKSINKQSRHYAKQSKFEGSFRSFRTKVVKELLSAPKNRLPHQTIQRLLQKELAESSFTPKEIILSLLKDQIIKETKTHYSI